MLYEEDNDDESLPIPRRSLVDRYQLSTNQFISDNELSPSERRQSRLSFNNSISIDSGIDEIIQTPLQLITLYEKTIELAAKNKINIKNAFDISLVERLPEILNLIAFDDKTDSHHEPNFVKVGSVIDTSAKIYGYRVDALHTETQKLSGSFLSQEAEESIQLKPIKKATQHYKSKSTSYIVSDLSTISIPYEFNFHPLQPSKLCQWPGGIGEDSIYSDMISYTMYSSSDFPLINGFINLNSRMNTEYVDNESMLDITAKTMYDLIPLREVIKDNEGENHILGCQTLREFTFNEESTESYIETIDECSMIIDSLNDEDDLGVLSDLRDEPMSFDFQELQSTYTCPMMMPSMDMTLAQSKISFVDQVPYLLREKTDLSDYTYFDAIKLKLFAGPYVWKYTNLLPYLIKQNPPSHQPIPLIQDRMKCNYVGSFGRATRNYRLDLLNPEKNRPLNELMSLSSLSKSITKRRKRTTLLTISKHTHQLRLTRRLRPLIDLTSSNNFSDLIFDDNLQILSNPDDRYSIDDNNYIPDYDNPPADQLEYDFIRPIHYDKIEFDKNFAKIDTKKLQYQLTDEYNHECLTSSLIPIKFSKLCVNLIDKNVLSIEKNELISAFYCMLNNCNKNNLFMKNTIQQDDLIIQKQPFINSIQLSYSHSIF